MSEEAPGGIVKDVDDFEVGRSPGRVSRENKNKCNRRLAALGKMDRTRPAVVWCARDRETPSASGNAGDSQGWFGAAANLAPFPPMGRPGYTTFVNGVHQELFTRSTNVTPDILTSDAVPRNFSRPLRSRTSEHRPETP